METIKPWHEDDTFWETFGPEMFTPKRWEEIPAKADELIALSGMQPGARVLDLCCGPGRFSLELARRGFKVTGVDRTRAYLEEARQRTEAENLAIEFVQNDMRQFCRFEGFDVTINLFTSFGYFEDQEDDRQVVANIFCSLKPGGILVLDVAGKEVIARIFCERNWEEHDGVIFLQERKIRRDWSWIENRWVMFKDDKRFDYTLSHRLYSAAELTKLLTECGFDEVKIYGDLAGSPYDHQAKRLLAVARKSERSAS
jgi:SAM-dependent methyltransferase